ncbi:MAG: Metalloendopeptidase-like protein membrane protein [Candidatus Yanofskybacteria bacterium GW2011_GWF1_44_227]|uniref:Metalloendopeptidase-like protein membrane protein n=1 Tax=Candidatus Yanofskybacteria bacterium GW2011_GWE2_40_11 TaxID=1619033 RepID=A0A0G0T2B4_9BACT|nr:MAG: Metalloendopeptidase-like protein membrane protein [Candidatus Yanofskybacteria bacterium GW2011_GWE1_40_10]KKR41230.1 MAG: Metalloendopeptidase-like protein membrane protein [Candidatus Yanofskybacteria bacterium GW2011_GWE2_40_11]KKT15694.1 MAG: Metalloendopeptidase-like protein membrane protein [Candidatus Yanofskybacteria bacterium GW2011_GWF2_43_596]KKT53418.1 MAG: Metalloendopeptidase-like protein membrane protein [Candidatus Yanofskybacteria bacterium GW2011_GWF1_44_227]OGN36172.
MTLSKNKKWKSDCLLFLLLAVFILLPSIVLAQTEQERIEELKAQIIQLEAEAAKFRTNIASEKAEAASLQVEINSLKSQISRIETQILLTSKKIDKTKIEMEDTQTTIFDTQKSIDYRKETIGELLMSINKYDAEPLVISLIKNQNLSDFLRQEQYARNINLNLLNMVAELKTEKSSLEQQVNDLEGKKEDLEAYNREQAAQRNSLGQATSVKNTLLKETKGQEALYQKMLKEAENKKMLFFTELRELETKIIQGGLYIVHVTAEKLPKKGTKLFSWPEGIKRITQGYGMTTYAKRGAYGGSPHNGVDMANGMGSEIKAIGDGEIIANGKNDGWGNWVAIKHPGQYNLVSVYAHMSSLSFLRVGTAVKLGQVIGYEGSTGNSSGSHLHLSIYKDFFTYVKDKNGQLYFNYFDGSINPLDYL